MKKTTLSFPRSTGKTGSLSAIGLIAAMARAWPSGPHRYLLRSPFKGMTAKQIEKAKRKQQVAKQRQRENENRERQSMRVLSGWDAKIRRVQCNHSRESFAGIPQWFLKLRGIAA